jgi:GNAT superfamily N-acetyltransferase
VHGVAGKAMLTAQDLPPSARGKRLHAAFEDGVPIAWVRSVQHHDVWSWNDSLFTTPQARGRGVAAALMRHLHRDDALWGVRASVSFSTPENFEYHRKYGYVKLASRLRFVPHKTILERVLRRISARVLRQ